MVVNDDGSYTIAGIVHGSSVGGYDIYVASIPKNGNITIEDGTDVGIIIEGDKLAGQGITTAANDADDLDDFAAEINRTDAGGYIIAGSTRTDANGSDMWLVEVSSEIEEVATFSIRYNFKSDTEYICLISGKKFLILEMGASTSKVPDYFELINGQFEKKEAKEA